MIASSRHSHSPSSHQHLHFSWDALVKVTTWHCLPWPTGLCRRSGAQSCAFSGQRPPRALLWGQLSYGWTCTPLWCSESYEMSAASSRPVASAQGLALTSPPERQGLWGGERLERGGVDHAISCRFYCSLLFPTLLAFFFFSGLDFIFLFLFFLILFYF